MNEIIAKMLGVVIMIAIVFLAIQTDRNYKPPIPLRIDITFKERSYHCKEVKQRYKPDDYIVNCERIK